MPTLEAQYQERMAEVAEKEALRASAEEQLAELGIATEAFDGLLASLPPQVIEVRDYILCGFPGYAEDFLQEKLDILARGYNVMDTMAKLNAIESALGAEIELEDAYHALDTVVRQMPAALRKSLEQQEAGQQSLF